MKFPYYKYFAFIVGTFIFVNIVMVSSFLHFLDILAKEEKNTIVRTIQAYDEIDLQNICTVMNCKSIKIVDYNSKQNIVWVNKGLKNNQLVRKIFSTKDIANRMKKRTLLKTKNYIITPDFNMILVVPEYSIKIETTKREYIINQLMINILIDLLALILFSVFYFISFARDKKKHMITIRNTSEEIRDKNMKILTENVHHELKTPLAIIQGITRINEIAFESLSRIVKQSRKFDDVDFESIYAAIDRVNIVLLRMSDFKQAVSNTSGKSLYYILEIPSKNLEIYTHCNFQIDIDKELENYILSGILTNEDLMNVFSSMLKNSVEATSSYIKVEYDLLSDSKMDIYIIDNGTGIRNKHGLMMLNNNWASIFKDNFSTKDEDGKSNIDNNTSKIHYFIKSFKSIFKVNKRKAFSRGNGLYINKEILTIAGCDLNLMETSADGTVFKISLNIKKKEQHKEIKCAN